MPMTMPTASAMRERHREGEPRRLEREAAAGAAGAEGERHHHRGERHHQFDRQIHVAGDQRQRQADGDDADEGRLLEDVEEDADLQEVRDGRREDRGDHDQDEPDQVVEDELDRGAAARGLGRWRPVSTVSVMRSTVGGTPTDCRTLLAGEVDSRLPANRLGNPVRGPRRCFTRRSRCRLRRRASTSALAAQPHRRSA